MRCPASFPSHFSYQTQFRTALRASLKTETNVFAREEPAAPNGTVSRRPKQSPTVKIAFARACFAEAATRRQARKDVTVFRDALN